MSCIFFPYFRLFLLFFSVTGVSVHGLFVVFAFLGSLLGKRSIWGIWWGIIVSFEMCIFCVFSDISIWMDQKLIKLLIYANKINILILEISHHKDPVFLRLNSLTYNSFWRIIIIQKYLNIRNVINQWNKKARKSGTKKRYIAYKEII